MIRNFQLCGQSIIAYLQQKGFPEVALHFVKDERTRFNLALECGNIDVALTSATAIDQKDTWYRLGVEALRQGNHQIVEFSYRKTKNFERLSFLYLITGNLDNLTKMLKIAEMRNDVMSRFHNALYLGDVEERVKVLEESGHAPLAYLTAATHGLTEIAEQLKEELGDRCPPLPAPEECELLMPPTPVLREDNWPLLMVTKSVFDRLEAGAAAAEADEEAGAGWGDDDLDLGAPGGADEGANGEAGEEGEEGEEGEDGEGGWGLDEGMEDLDLPADVGGADVGIVADGGFFVAPPPGVPVSQKWAQKTVLAGEQVAAGAFDAAMRLLSRQLGIKNFAPLRQGFIDLSLGSHAALPCLASVPVVQQPLEAGWTENTPPGQWQHPSLVYRLGSLEDKLKQAYKLTTDGKFTDALKVFKTILHTIPLLVVETRREVDEVKELLGIAKEYALALRIELKRKDTSDPPTPARQVRCCPAL